MTRSGGGRRAHDPSRRTDPEKQVVYPSRNDRPGNHTYSVRYQWEADTQETRRPRAEAPVQGPLPRKATGEVRHDPPEGDRRDLSQLPHEEGAHPRCRRPSPGTRRRRRGGVDTQRNDIGGSRAAKTASERYTSPPPRRAARHRNWCRGDWLCEGSSEERPRRSSGVRTRPRERSAQRSGAFLAERAAVASTAPLPEQSP
jgi:hypothetical protein